MEQRFPPNSTCSGNELSSIDVTYRLVERSIADRNRKRDALPQPRERCHTFHICGKRVDQRHKIAEASDKMKAEEMKEGNSQTSWAEEDLYRQNE